MASTRSRVKKKQNKHHLFIAQTRWSATIQLAHLLQTFSINLTWSWIHFWILSQHTIVCASIKLLFTFKLKDKKVADVCGNPLSNEALQHQSVIKHDSLDELFNRWVEFNVNKVLSLYFSRTLSFNRKTVSNINAPNVADENFSHGSANMTNSYKFARILTARKFMDILRAWRELKWTSFSSKTRSSNSIFAWHLFAKTCKGTKRNNFCHRLRRIIFNSSIIQSREVRHEVWISSRKRQNVIVMIHKHFWMWSRMMHLFVESCKIFMLLARRRGSIFLCSKSALVLHKHFAKDTALETGYHSRKTINNERF